MNALNAVVDISKKNMHLFILAVYAYVLFQIEENDYITMILLTVAACLSICYLKKSPLVESYVMKNTSSPSLVNQDTTTQNTTTQDTPTQDTPTQDTPSQDTPTKTKEGFENAPKIMNQKPDMMGPYDGLCLQTGNKQAWMKTPDETALVPNDALFTYLSSQGPTKPVFTDNSSLNGPSVDGHPDSDKKMFMLANNRTSPNCCPSTFSTSTGCVCTTKNQRDFVASRGGATLADGKKADLQDI
jgi:hypothetical protein